MIVTENFDCKIVINYYNERKIQFTNFCCSRIFFCEKAKLQQLSFCTKFFAYGNSFFFFKFNALI